MAESVRAMNPEVKAMADREGKYLTFTLAKEEYGISILKVKEIMGMMPITTVPRTSGFLKGVINLSGKMIPVVDLRLKFGMEEKTYTDEPASLWWRSRGRASRFSSGSWSMRFPRC